MKLEYRIFLKREENLEIGMICNLLGHAEILCGYVLVKLFVTKVLKKNPQVLPNIQGMKSKQNNH